MFKELICERPYLTSDAGRQITTMCYEIKNTYSGSSVFILNCNQEFVKKQFEELKKQWKEKTELNSTIREMASDDNYRGIVRLGTMALPYVFEELKKSDRRRWMLVLHDITGANPVERNHYRNLEEMIEDWIKWGKSSNYIS